MDDYCFRLGEHGRYNTHGDVWAGSQKRFGWSLTTQMILGGAIAVLELLMLRGTTRKHFQPVGAVGCGRVRPAPADLCSPDARKYEALLNSWQINKRRENKNTSRNLVK